MRKNRCGRQFWIFVCFLLIAANCSKREEKKKEIAVTQSIITIDPGKLRMFSPLPVVMESTSNPVTEEKVALGRMLFFDQRLSVNGSISCNTCHRLDNWGVDGDPTSKGHDGSRGNRNSPTVYNAAGHFVQFWDGRSPDIEDQAKGPVLNPVEMGMPKADEVVAALKAIPGYVDAFKRAFAADADPVTFDNAAKAIGAFERKLVTPSRWDQFLKGEQNALAEGEKAGFNAYVEAGCTACHAGPYVGGNLFQKLGVAKPWPDTSDLGRESVTKDESDRMIFKAPSLRNVEKTGPYFHNGKVKTLQQAVELMAEYELGTSLSAEQVRSINEFLKALTGTIPAEYVKEPAFPQG